MNVLDERTSEWTRVDMNESIGNEDDDAGLLEQRAGEVSDVVSLGPKRRQKPDGVCEKGTQTKQSMCRSIQKH